MPTISLNKTEKSQAAPPNYSLIHKDIYFSPYSFTYLRKGALPLPTASQGRYTLPFHNSPRGKLLETFFGQNCVDEHLGEKLGG